MPQRHDPYEQPASDRSSSGPSPATPIPPIPPVSSVPPVAPVGPFPPASASAPPAAPPTAIDGPGGSARRREPHQRAAALRRWRLIQALAGFALASTCAMPAVSGCSSPIVPAVEMATALASNPLSLTTILGVFMMFVAAYLLGVLCAFQAIGQLRRPHLPKPQRGVSVAVLLELVCVPLLCGMIIDLQEYATPSGAELLFGALVVASFAYWLRAVRRGAQGLICLRWYTALCTVAWFTYWLVAADPRYGLYISVGSSICLLVALTGECSWLAETSLLRTLRALLTVNLKIRSESAEPRCTHCGYLLIGLNTPRCPECGQPFAALPGPAADNIAGPPLPGTDLPA